MSSPSQRMLTDIGILGIAQFVTKLRGLILLPVIAGLLGTAEYGVWSQAVTTILVGGRLVTLQLHELLVRDVSGTNDKAVQREYFYSLFALIPLAGLLPIVLLAAFPVFFSRLLLGDPAYFPITQLLGPLILLNALHLMILDLLRGLHKSKLYGAIEAGRSLLQLAVSVVFLILTEDLYLTFVALTVLEIVSLLMLTVGVARAIGFSIPTFRYVRSSLAFSLPLMPALIAELALTFGDRYLINIFLGSSAVGIYTAAINLSRLLNEIFRPFRIALYPSVSRLWDQGKSDKVKSQLESFIGYGWILAFPAYVGLVVLAPPILNFLASPEFAIFARPIVLISGVGFLLFNVAAILSIGLRVLKETTTIAFGLILAAIVQLILLLIAVPRVGIIGGAIGLLGGYATLFLFNRGALYRRMEFHIPLTRILKSIIASAFLVPLLLGLGGRSGILGAVLLVAISIPLYFGIMILIGGIQREELDFIRNLRSDIEPTINE